MEKNNSSVEFNNSNLKSLYSGTVDVFGKNPFLEPYNSNTTINPNNLSYSPGETIDFKNEIQEKEEELNYLKEKIRQLETTKRHKKIYNLGRLREKNIGRTRTLYKSGYLDHLNYTLVMDYHLGEI